MLRVERIEFAYLSLQLLAPLLTSGPRIWLSILPLPIVGIYWLEAVRHAQAPDQAT